MWGLPHAPMHEAAPVHPNSGSFPVFNAVTLASLQFSDNGNVNT